MAVKQLRESWPDDRLDELNKKVDVGFEKVDERFKAVDARFDKVDERFDKVDVRFSKVDERFDKVDEQFEKVDERFDEARVETKSDMTLLRGEMNDRFALLDKKIDRLTYCLLAAAIGYIVTHAI